MKDYPNAQIQELLDNASNILIALPKGVYFDQLAAGLALSLCLQKIGKKVTVVCPDPMRVEFSRLVGVDKVTDKPSGNDLAITFEYPLEGIEKVTSDDNNGKLCLTVKIKNSQPAIKPEQVIFTSAGANSDLIFTVGLRKFEGLGKIYLDYKEIFDTKPIINIDNNLANTAYGKINIIDPGSCALSETINYLILEMQMPVDADIATNILLGLEAATDNFRSLKVTADTFEAASQALRAGGRRGGITSSTPEATFSAPSPTPELPSAKEPARDWMEPKIYKGSTLP